MGGTNYGNFKEPLPDTKK